MVFKIAEAGVWGEAVRQRRPIIINDYESYDSKKGIPEGHVAISRFMAVPLFDDKNIVAVAAVGNKKNEYDDHDVKQLQLLIEGMWQMIKRRLAEEKFIKQAEMIKHFTNKVSHDLKNPAVAIHGLARIIEKKFDRLEREKLANYNKQIVNSSAQILSLAEDINAYISSRETQLHCTDIDLREIWRLIREEFFSQLKEREIIWVEPEGDIPSIRADKTGLLRVFRNLVDNALKYGGDALSEIGVGYETTEIHHVLSVHNNGETIPSDETETIFKLFERKADGSSACGTGLGLAIVKEIARHHMGDSWVDSGDGAKTTFYFSISRNLRN
jgi:signal transduction histidine kinase